MSVFKQLNKADVITLPFTANKEWTFDNTTLFNYIYIGIKDTGSFNSIGSPTYNGQFENLLYDQINHLYYQQFTGSIDTGSLILSTNYESASSAYALTNYDNNLQSYRDSRVGFPTGSGETIQIINIPTVIYGSKIKPSTFTLTSSFYSIRDDGWGNLIDYNVSTASQVGNIIYGRGTAIITSQSYQNVFTSSYLCSFKNEHIVYENIIKCTIKEYEMNVSYNPTLRQNLTSSESPLVAFTTGSDFRPYATSVGLYNDFGDLLMIAKFSQPLPISNTTDTTILIKYDT